MFLKSLAIATALAAAPLVALAGQGDPTIDYDKLDVRMNAAQDEARSHLDQFFANVLDANGIGQQGSGLKVAFPIGEESYEVIWVSPFGMKDGQLVGILANEPREMDGHAAGDRVMFDRDQVRDWYFFGADGKMYGSYTTRVMLPDMPEDTAAQVSEMLSDAPLPADW